MTIFDLIVIAVLLLSVGLAAVRGALLEIATLLAAAIAVFIALQFTDTIAAQVGGGSFVKITISHAILIFVLFVILYVIIHILLTKFSLSSRGVQINRIAGALFGFVRGYLIVGLGFLAYGYYLDEAHQHDSVREAMTRSFAISGASFFEQFIPETTRLETDTDKKPDDDTDAAVEGYGRSDRAGLSEVITTVTTTDTQQKDVAPDPDSQADTASNDNDPR